jgi:hypothetical protein
VHEIECHKTLYYSKLVHLTGNNLIKKDIADYLIDNSRSVDDIDSFFQDDDLL